MKEYQDVYLPARNLAARTRTEYINDLEDLVKYLEKIGLDRVGEIGLIHLERYLAELDKRGYSGSTRKRKAVTIRSLFSFLSVSGHITNNISKRLIPPLADCDLPRVLTRREYRRLLEVCSNNARDRAIIELLLQTGIRLSELTRLSIYDIELPDTSDDNPEDLGTMGTIRIVKSNGHKKRLIPLNDKAYKAIRDYLRVRPDTKINRLFLNRFNRQLGPRGVQKVVKKYLAAASIMGASVHSLRHTFGVHHAARGTSIKTIQKTMGHKDIRSTVIYVSLANIMVGKELQQHAL